MFLNSSIKSMPFIRSDGTTTTTASIPFAQGASIAEAKKLQLGASADAYLLADLVGGGITGIGLEATIGSNKSLFFSNYSPGGSITFDTPNIQLQLDELSSPQSLFFSGPRVALEAATRGEFNQGPFYVGYSSPASLNISSGSTFNTLSGSTANFQSGSTTTFNNRPTFAAGALLSDNQTIQYGGATRYTQRVSASNTLQTYLDGASDIFEQRVRGASGSKLTQNLGFSFQTNVADSAGAEAFEINQTTALTHQTLVANERRFLSIQNGSTDIAKIIPAPYPINGGCLQINQINLRPNAASSDGYLFNATQSWLSGEITNNFTAVSGFISILPGTSGKGYYGLNFGMLANNPSAGQNAATHGAFIQFNTPTSGAFNPTSQVPTGLFTQLIFQDSSCNEIDCQRASLSAIGTYSNLGTVRGHKVENLLGGVYGTVTEQLGYEPILQASYGGTGRGYGIRVPAFTNTFTDSWGGCFEEDLQVVEGTSMYYDGSLTTKGNTRHYYSSGLKLEVDGTLVTTDTTTTRTFADAINIAFGSTTGSKLATATTQKIGFWGATPVARPSAYTQTYSTATKTHSNPTATTVSTTAATNTTPWGYTTQAQANAIVTAINALITDVANVKQVLNAVIDDNQTIGLFG